jgi:hypothetical protein
MNVRASGNGTTSRLVVKWFRCRWLLHSFRFQRGAFSRTPPAGATRKALSSSPPPFLFFSFSLFPFSHLPFSQMPKDTALCAWNALHVRFWCNMHALDGLHAPKHAENEVIWAIWLLSCAHAL